MIERLYRVYTAKSQEYFQRRSHISQIENNNLYTQGSGRWKEQVSEKENPWVLMVSNPTTWAENCQENVYHGPNDLLQGN